MPEFLGTLWEGKVYYREGHEVREGFFRKLFLRNVIRHITIEVDGNVQSAHPGEIIKEQCLEPLGINLTQAAKALGVSQ